MDYIAIYWKTDNDLEEDINKIVNFFDDLYQIDSELFNTWYLTGETYEEAKQNKVEDVLTVINNSLTKARLEDNAEYISFSVWKPISEEANIGLSISSHLSFWVSRGISINNVTLKLDHLIEEGVIEIEKAIQILIRMIIIWSPDSGIITSYALRNYIKEKYDKDYNNYKLGWITYFKSLDKVFLPAPTYKINIDNYGSLLVLTDEFISIDNMYHQNILDDTIKELAEKNIL